MKPRFSRRWHGLGLLGLLVACGEAPEQILSEFPAPDGDYQLRLTLVAAASASAPHQLKLYLVPRGMAVSTPVVSTELANDGTPFSGDQVGLTWITQRTVLMCMKPRTQSHHGIRVELSEPPRVEKVSRC